MFLSLTPVYDASQLELTALTDAPSGWTVIGKANWDGAGDETFTGNVLTLSFRAKASASGSTAVRLTAEAYNHAEEVVTFSVSPGTVTFTGTAPKPTVNPDPVPSDNVANFVLRCYTRGLGRDEASVRVNDAGGLRYWYDILKSKQLTCQQVGTYFAASDEATTKYPGNEEFVSMLYRLYMEDRSYDQGGFDYWVGLLNNGTLTRAQVNDYFGVSDEFRAIVASYGL